MAATGRGIFQAHMDGLLPESVPIDTQWTFGNGILQINPSTLGSGDNNVTPPVGTKIIIMIPPVTNVATLVWSKTGGATNGITQPSNAPNITAYGAGAVIVNSSASVPVTFIYLG